jgi:hypothetical protein
VFLLLPVLSFTTDQAVIYHCLRALIGLFPQIMNFGEVAISAISKNENILKSVTIDGTLCKLLNRCDYLVCG